MGFILFKWVPHWDIALLMCNNAEKGKDVNPEGIRDWRRSHHNKFETRK